MSLTNCPGKSSKYFRLKRYTGYLSNLLSALPENDPAKRDATGSHRMRCGMSQPWLKFVFSSSRPAHPTQYAVSNTAYLTGCLRSRGYETEQADLGLDMILRLFHGQASNRRFIESNRRIQPGPERSTKSWLLEEAYPNHRAGRPFFRKGSYAGPAPRQAGISSRRAAISADRRPGEGMHVCSRPMPPPSGNLYIEDLTDLPHETVAPTCFLNRYAEQIMEATSLFDRIEEALSQP